MAHFDEDDSRAKRRKIHDGSAAAPEPSITITSHNQLRTLLAFQQSVSPDVKRGVRAFKNFLTSISANEDQDERAKSLQILKSYCDSQFVKEGDESRAACFVDLIQTWSFAETSNEESLLSLVPSVLALFLKVVSTHLDFREFGVALCKFLLQKEQLQLFNRGLTASKSREHLISPCLRLLTEVVSFDGGAVARLLYSRRDVTLKRLEIFLSVRKVAADEENDLERKPGLRRIALRYLVANFKFQNAAAKEELIGQGKLIRAFLEDIRRDGRDIVLDIIRTLDKHFAADSSLSRSAKSRLLNRWNLERLVTLYGFERETSDPVPEGGSVSAEIHRFLTTVCTNPEKGILLPDNGWYPSGSTPDIAQTNDNETIALGLDSPLYFDKYDVSVPVRNGNLSAMIQHLRPDSDTLQMELLLKIFKAAPELVCDFFSKRTMFISDPKPIPSWLGESAFLFSTVQLPVPANCGWKDTAPAVPPPVSVVIESVMPRPLTQKMLTRCINQNSDVVTLFAIRVTTLALRKLQAVLRIFQADRAAGQELWSQAGAKLVDAFCRRSPTMKDTISAFRQTPKDNLPQQEAMLELLATFYQVLPEIAFEAKFDVSLTLLDVLKRLDNSEQPKEDRESLLNQLEHLSIISQQSPNMRWWQKPESLEYSALTSVLKVLVDTDEQTAMTEINNLVSDVLIRNSCLAGQSSFDALIKSLRGSSGDNLKTQLAFLDNCLVRLAKKPVLYLDTVENLLGARNGKLSALMAAISEQWPFVVKSGNKEKDTTIASWLAKLLGCLRIAGEDEEALTSLRDSIQSATDNKKSVSALKRAFKHSEAVTDELQDFSTEVLSKNGSTNKAVHPRLSEAFGEMPVEDETHAALHKWEREDLEEALEQGYIGELLLCLCSEHEEIRRQAYAAVNRFMIKLKDSAYEERQTVYVLAGEVLETVKEMGFESRLPYLAGELAARMLLVLIDPLHRLYGKVNSFLNKGPRWEIGKIPSYWVDKILFHEPEHDDGYHYEVGWLLDLFVHGLRSEKDMDLYRRAGVFERVLSLYNSPATAESSKKKALHLLYRACEAGGSTTLLTRAGAVSWIQGQAATLDSNSDVLQQLANELCSVCDRDWVDRWSGSALLETCGQIASVQ